jgi:co-chaperonin GroES (HSP10)
MSEIEVADLRPSKEVKEYHPFRPILDRILLSRVESDKDTSGFTIPDKYREPEAKGTVVAIGDGVTLGGKWHPMSEFVNVGDEVLFGAMTVEKILLDGKEFELARLQDVRGVRRLVRDCAHNWLKVMDGLAKCKNCGQTEVANV